MAQDTMTRRSVLGSGTGTQLFLGLLWLGITAWTTYATLTVEQDGPSGALGAAAEALPGIVSTAIVTGASIASAAASRSERALARLLIGLVTGLLFGVAVAAGLRFAYGDEPSVSVLVITVGLACVVGGAAAVLPGAVLEAGLWAVTWVFFAFLILGVLQPQAEKFVGEARFVYLVPVAAGLLGGLHGYHNLRTERPAVLWYAVAGALPGLILLAGEALTGTGGTSLAAVVHGFSSGDTPVPVEDLSSAARVRDALIVLAVGAVIALLGGARANRRASKEDEA